MVARSRAMSGYWHSWRESEVEAADEGVTVPGMIVRRCRKVKLKVNAKGESEGRLRIYKFTESFTDDLR